MGKPWTLADIPSQAGKRILITGANSGIGYYAAFTFARKGAHVIFACRDRRKCEVALARLDAETPGASTELAILDLASLASVREFAARQLDLGQPIDILINNAGVMAPPTRRETADGFELQFATNVLGHFALTGLLLRRCSRLPIDLPRRHASLRLRRSRTNAGGCTSMICNISRIMVR